MPLRTALAVAIVTFGLLLALPGVTYAQAPTVQRAYENVRGRLDDLLTAKDQQSGSELALRIETFKKVLELSVIETKDLKVRLLTLDTSKATASVWLQSMIGALDGAMSHYKAERELIDAQADTIDFEGMKSLADAFKSWRDSQYLPIANRILDFILITQEEAAIATARTRADKIAADIVKLEKARVSGTEKLSALLSKANELISAAATLNHSAQVLFWDQVGATSAATSSIVTSTPPFASSSPEIMPLPFIGAAASSTPPSATTTTSTAEHLSSSSPESFLPSESSSTEPMATTTPPTLPPSIKDLVKDSLARVKDAYQVFIEMSNLVRKLLR